MKTFNLKSITLVLFLLSASLQVWADKTYNNGDVLYFDFSAVPTSKKGVNWQDNNWHYEANGAGTVITATFTGSYTFNTNITVAKTEYGDWNDIKWKDPGAGQNCLIISSDGKSFTWGTYAPATPTTTTFYFDNSTTNWSNVYLYLYSKNYYESNGSGSESSKGCYAQCLQMSLVTGSSKIYKYEYTGNEPAYVCFLNASQSSYGNFWNGTAGTVRGAYKQFTDNTKTLYTPTSTYETKNNVYYYNSGSWSKYPPSSYTLTMAKGTGGASTSPTVGAHTITGAQAISATASSGYRFLNWTASPDANVTFASAKTTNSNSVTLKGNATVTANFEHTYTLTVTSQTSGSITAPSGGTATVGASQTTTITATPNSGYGFYKWTIESGTATITSPTSISTTVTSVTANTVIKANFAALSSYYIRGNKEFCGNWNTSSARMLTSADGSYYYYLVPAGNGDLQFAITDHASNWSANGATEYKTEDNTLGNLALKHADNGMGGYNLQLNTSRSGAYYIVLYQSMNKICAVDDLVNLTGITSYTLTVNVSPSGAGSITAPSGGTATVTKYSTTTITATKNNGYTFVNWTKTGTATIANANNLSTTVTNVQSDATVTANFTQDQYTVTYNANGGTGTQTDASTYTYGSTVTVKSQGSVTRTGYTFGGWNTNSSGTGTNYAAGTGTFTITGNTTLYAKWTENKHNVTISYKCGSTTIKDNTTQSNVGEVNATSITAATINGYTFSSWTVGSGVTITTGTTSSSTISINTKASGDYTLTANYTQDEYTVTVGADGGSITTPAEGRYTGKHYGDKVAITAFASSGYPFAGWIASPSENATFDNENTISTNATIKGNVTITAKFSLPLTIYVSNEDCADDVYIHYWGIEGATVSFPGVPMSKNDAGWYYYTFPAGTTSVNYIISAGASDNQTGDQTATATVYYKYKKSDKSYTATTSSYTPNSCTPDVYTVVGPTAYLGSNWDLSDPLNELSWNATYGRYEIRKMGVQVNNGATVECKFVRNHCYSGDGCGQWPNSGNASKIYAGTSGKKDILFWVKPSGDFSHPGMNDNCDIEIYDAATYYLNHPWNSGGWEKKEMTYTGTGLLYTVSGVLGANAGADVFKGEAKEKYFANNASEISGYGNVSAGDNVTFTYDATNKTLSVSCPTCFPTYWIRHGWNGSWNGDADWKKMIVQEDGTYMLTNVKWGNTIADVNTTKAYNVNQIQAGNIVNHDKFNVGDLVTFIYDPDINQLTIIDANTPQITLAATQVVNAEATQSVITLETTSTKILTNPQYTYTLVSGPAGGVFAENPTATTTFTTTKEGTYNFQVTVKADQGTFTATATIKVKFKIRILAYIGNTTWASTIKIHYWETGKTGTDQNMTQIGSSKWYEYTVKGLPEVNFLVFNNTKNSNNQTVNVGPIDDDICIIVNTTVTTESGVNKYNYTTTTDCELYQRFASTYEQMKGANSTGKTTTVYSNYFKQDGDEVSFYIGSTPNVKHQTFNSATNKWNEGTVINGLTGGDVYAGYYDASATTRLKNWKVYTGDFYIRTDGASGGWSNYKNENQAFFEFSHNDYYPNEWYNHYWCRWTNNNTNVKAVVANEINPVLTDTLPDFILTSGDGTNMRFEYDNSTNFIGRQFLKGSGGDFLRIFASDDDADNFIYKTDAPTTRIKKSNAVTFNDMSDWVYQIDVKAKPTSSDVKVYVLGRYPVTRAGIGAASDQDNYLGGYDIDGTTPLPIKIMGSGTTADTYNMRLIYDYKTNRLIAAWYPAGDKIGGTETTVDANFLITRTDDANAVTFDMANSGAKVVSINQMYSALIITRTAYNTRKSSGNYYYWVSLPYDVMVRDIFGINGYGKKWVVQRYRGDMRAKYGFRDDIETFWANMKQNATAKMEANRGYVIRLQLTDADFKEINGNSQVTLYFPSCNTEDITLQNSSTALQSTVPAHLCEVVEPVSGNSRTNWDSHWNVIGQPGLKTMAITTPTSISGHTDEYIHHPYYYYKWSWEAGAGKYTPTAVSGGDNAFKTMYAYMVQYGGETITWQPNIKTIDPSLAPRRMPQAKQQDILISLTASAEREVEHIVGEDLHSEYEQVTDFDRTILTMSEQGTDSFVLNQDMSKTKSGKLNIYTIFDKTNTAGKVIPMDTKEVPVVVEINYDNDVTFALDKDVTDKTITFIDYQEGTETILNYAPYTVSLSAGVYDQRFAIRISERSEIATDLPHATDTNSKLRLLQDGQMFYIEGLTEKQSLSIFDATGKCCLTTTVDNCERFSVPAQGIYLLQIDGQTFKVTTR